MDENNLFKIIVIQTLFPKIILVKTLFSKILFFQSACSRIIFIRTQISKIILIKTDACIAFLYIHRLFEIGYHILCAVYVLEGDTPND